MRWILPLLSLVLIPSAFGELAVYTGSLAVQNVGNSGGSSFVRVADVVDLSTGKIVTIGLSGSRTALSYAVGPEVQYVVAKTTDGLGRGVTAFAQASMDTDSAGSKFAMATNLRGRDTTVSLADGSTSQWPRMLVGSGSLIAAAGTDPSTAPASVSFSSIALNLDDSLSKLANASGGTLSQATEVVAQRFRNRVAAVLKVTPSNDTLVAGTTTTGVTKTGAGTLLFGSTANTFTGAVTISNGTLRLNSGGSGSVTTINGGTVPVAGGTTTVGGGTLTFSGAGSGSLTLSSGVSSGSLVLNPTGGWLGSGVGASSSTVSSFPTAGTINISGAGLTGATNSVLTLNNVHPGTLPPIIPIGSGSISAGSGSFQLGSGAVISTIGSGSLNFSNADGATLTSAVGTTGLIKTGQGTITLGNASQGTFTLTNPGSVANTSGAVFGPASETLTYNGNRVIFANGGSLTVNGATYVSNGAGGATLSLPGGTTATGPTIVTTTPGSPAPTTTDSVDPGTPAQ